MKQMTLVSVLLLLASGCYNPELPSEVDQYFSHTNDGIVKMGKAFMVDLYLGNHESAAQYLSEPADTTVLNDFATTLSADIDLFKKYYKDGRLPFTKSDPIQITRSNYFVFAAMKKGKGGATSGNCLYYVFNFECKDEQYRSRLVNFDYAQENCKFTSFEKVSKVPFPFETNMTNACFF